MIRFLGSLFLLTAILTLSGCQSDDRTADGRIKLRYWEKWTGFEKSAMEEVVKKFNESQDRIYVEFISTSQIDRKLLLAAAGGNPPDVAGFWGDRLPSYVDNGALIPLDSLMERDGISRDDYIQSVIDVCSYRGFTWGLPSTPATLAIHYNRDLFREAGLDPDNFPETMEEFREAADKLVKRDKDGGYTRMGFLPTDPGWWGTMWGAWFGGQLISDDGREITCDSPEMIKAFEWMRSWKWRHDGKEVQLFEAAHRGQFASPSNSLMSGRLAMKLQGVWMANFIEEFAPDMDWGAAPLPAAEDVTGGPATVVQVDMLVIPRGAKYAEESWEFIKFVNQRENMELLCRLQRKFSPLIDVSEDFANDHPNPYIDLFRELAESPNAMAEPQSPVWIEYRDDLTAAISTMWLTPESEVSTEEIMKSVKRRIQPKLDRSWARWDAIGDQRMKEWTRI